MELADTIRLFMNSAEATLQRSCWALRLTGMLYGTSSNLSLIVRCRPDPDIGRSREQTLKPVEAAVRIAVKRRRNIHQEGVNEPLT
ncbi:MAG: hypothetical protein E8D46_17680 [Nitrospira sp.]|nr:MAG: hypothetical protein E8D46_17680 [Nitrospira sp.]